MATCLPSRQSVSTHSTAGVLGVGTGLICNCLHCECPDSRYQKIDLARNRAFYHGSNSRFERDRNCYVLRGAALLIACRTWLNQSSIEGGIKSERAHPVFDLLRIYQKFSPQHVRQRNQNICRKCIFRLLHSTQIRTDICSLFT